MAGRGPSRQELIRRRRSVGFIGRQGEVDAFRDALRQSPEEAAQFLFHVRGPAGVGKSTLVRQLETIAREVGAVTAYVDESVADVVETMEVISAQFAQQGFTLKGFDRLLATYRQRRHEADAGLAAAAAAASEPAVGAAPSAPPSASSVIASQLGLVGLGMIPGVGAFTGAVDPNQVAAGADRVKALLSTRLRSHGDVELVLSPLDALTPVFLGELTEVARRHPWIVLFFDTYERTGPMLDAWLRDVLGTERYGELPANVLVTLSGQSRLAARTWEDWHDLVTDWPLDVFTETEARRLLSGKGITDERVVEVILRLSGRLPVLVSTLAETQPGTVEEIGDPSGTAVERFLKWEPDLARRAAALACAFPRELDEDVYRAAVEEEASELFAWLRSMPFVTDRSGHCRYHDVVRGAMLRLQRRQSPVRWEQLHTRLADAFRHRREHLEEATAPTAGWWSDETWRGHRLEETYHRLCADPRAALPAALHELLDAYDHGITTLRRWAAALAGAGVDADSPELTGWAEELRAALDEAAPGVAALTLLVARPGLEPAGRATALALRGRDHRAAGDYDRALADYTQAVTLNPQAGRAWSGRAVTHLLIRNYDTAIADYTRAIELEPDDAMSLVSRGTLYRVTGRYEEALADVDRVLETTPDHQGATAARAGIYHALDRYEEALDDFTRHLTTAPEDEAQTLAGRGGTYAALERYEEAFEDFGRAIELDPGLAWAFTSRGLAHRKRERHEEALADFTRAAELSPDNAWPVTHRAETYRKAGRYEEALADYTRAIELDPRSVWALSGRGSTLEAMGRHDDALADFDHAVAYEPNFPPLFHLRGTAWAHAGRFEEALADFDRLHELSPDNSWAVRRRGDCRRVLGAYEDALNDYGLAVGLRSADASTLTARGVAHRLLGHYAEALADLTRSIELDADDAWTHYETAVAMSALGHPGGDHHLTRAVELLGPPAAGKRGAFEADNLVLAYCLWGCWEQAEQRLAEFLDAAEPPGQVRLLIIGLRSLVPVIPSAEPRIAVFCQMLEERLTGRRAQ